MALSRTDISDGLIDELHGFEMLVRSLTPVDLELPSRCDGWTVGDVARHVIGSMADVAAGRLDGLGTPEVTAREVAERQGRGADDLADECAQVTKTSAALLEMFDDTAWGGPAGGGYDGTLGRGVEALWYDTWLHGDDIRSAIGRPSEQGNGLRCALSHVGFELSKVAWSGSVPTPDDPRAFEFILAATGRGDAAAFGAEAPLDLYAT
jgi:uncharacterized protein (TIGR03083 family)